MQTHPWLLRRRMHSKRGKYEIYNYWGSDMVNRPVPRNRKKNIITQVYQTIFYSIFSQCSKGIIFLHFHCTNSILLLLPLLKVVPPTIPNMSAMRGRSIYQLFLLPSCFSSSNNKRERRTSFQEYMVLPTVFVCCSSLVCTTKYSLHSDSYNVSTQQ